MPTGLAVALLVVATCALIASPVLARRRVSVGVTILAIGYPMFAILTVALYRPTSNQYTGPDRLPNTYFDTVSALTVVAAFAAIGFTCWAGGQVVSLVACPRLEADSSESLRLRLPGGALLFPVLVLVCQLIGTGPSTALHSPAYLTATGPPTLLKLGTALVPLAVIVAANVTLSPAATGAARLMGTLTLAATELYLFGQATRTFAAFFVLIFVGGWLTGRWDRGQMVRRLVAAVAAAVLLLGVPLSLRGQPDHGLIPALGYLFTDPSSFFTGIGNPLYNTLLGVPLSVYEWQQIPPIGNSALWVSLNPLPGGAAGWTTLAPQLRLNAFEPYSAVGELLNHGWTVTLTFSAAVGAILEMAARVARGARDSWGSAGQGLVIGMAGLLLIRSTQYNLRTEARLVYYLIVAVVLVRLAALVTSRHRGRFGVEQLHQHAPGRRRRASV